MVRLIIDRFLQLYDQLCESENKAEDFEMGDTNGGGFCRIWERCHKYMTAIDVATEKIHSLYMQLEEC